MHRLNHFTARNGLLASVLLCTPVICTAALNAQESATAANTNNAPMVTEVAINGAVFAHADLIRLQLKTTAGKPFKLADLQDDERSITRMEPFTFLSSRVLQLPDNNIKIIFNVKELTYVSDVQFKGVGYWDRSNLAKKIKTSAGGYMHPHVVEADRRRLLDHFRQKNLLEVTVESQHTIDPSTGFIHLAFHISLGQKIKVDRVFFTGLPEDVFKYFMLPLMTNTNNAAFQENMLRWDRRTITNYIRDRGYLNAKVAPIQVDFYDGLRGSDPRRRHGPSVAPDNKKNNRAVLTLAVDAGKRFHLGTVSFVGNTVATEESLREAFKPQHGDVFDDRIITRNTARVQRVLRNSGRPKAFVRRDMRIELPDANNHLLQPLVHLTLHVYEGKKYTVGRIDVDGNRLTKDAVVRRALAIHPGDAYNEDNVQESIRQLRRIGLFATTAPDPLRIAQFYDPARPDQVDLRVHLNETGTGQVSAGAAFSSADSFSFNVAYSERNFDILGLFNGYARGGAQILKTSITTSSQQTDFNLSWTNPHVFDSHYSVSTFIRRSDQSRDTADWNEELLETGGSIGRRFLKNDLLLSIGYTYSTRLIDNVDSDAPNDALDADGKKFELHALTFRQRYDRLDVRQQPTKGFKIDLRETLTGGVLSATDEFLDLYANIDIFIPLSQSDFGGTTRIHIGQENRWLSTIGDTATVPFYQRIRGGGPAPRHRGYAAGRLGPTEINVNNIETRPGGITKWLTTIELIHPLQGRSGGIEGLLFYDLGNVWSADETIDLSSLRSAAGFGIRFPMQFPIALDFAWRLDNKDDEARTEFHFSIGGAF